MQVVPSLNLVFTEEEGYVTADVAEEKGLVSHHRWQVAPHSVRIHTPIHHVFPFSFSGFLGVTGVEAAFVERLLNQRLYDSFPCSSKG